MNINYMTKNHFNFLHILISFLLFSCATSVYAASQRIISLTPNVTELLYEIGAEQQIVATVEYSDYPESAKALPRVGDVYQLDWERILRLQPDLVIGWEDGTPQHVLERVKSLGLPLAIVRAGKLDSIAVQLRQLGSLTGKTKQAEHIADDFLENLEMLRKTYNGRKKVSVFYEIDHKPLYTINGQQIISDAINLCGGVNIFSELNILAPQVSVESVIHRSPDIIIYAGSVAESENVFSDWKRWAQIPAVRNSHMHRINPDLMNRPTPRMLQGIKQLCDILDAVR